MSEDQRPPNDSSSGKHLGDFELLREIGRGGMGVVYEARQISLKRRVALKVLPPALGMSAQANQRFEREAQAAAKLHHTNIVPVHAIGEHDDHHFYAMDLIDGQSLDQVLRDMVDAGANPLMETAVTQTATELRPQKPATSSQEQATTSLSDTSAGGREWFDAVAKLMAEVADGLHYAHGRGVIHRDVKPANLMLSREGHLSITDFGLARLLEEPGMTVSGSFLGTPAYMAPEQIAAGRIKVDHRADIYSLGAVLYEMLTMQRPFGGQSREQVLAAVMTKDPRPPRRFNGKIPVDLETICLKALEKDADRRYATAGEMAQDLRQHLQGGVIAARRAGIARRTWKAIRRHPTATLAVVAVLVVVAVAVVAWQAGGRGKEAQRLVADARLALREGTYREGLQLIDRAIALDPAAIDARIVRARLLIMPYHMHEAADEARLVLKTDPQNYQAHTILAGLALHPWGIVRLVRIDPEPHMRVVEATAPESAEAYLLRALNTTDTGRRVELLNRALDLNPDDQLASEAKMMALGQLLDLEETLPETDRQIATRPKSALGWQMKALSFAGFQDFENALAAINRALEVDDRDAWTYHSRAQILLQMGEVEEGFSDLTRSVELDPTLGFHYQFRAQQLNRMGRFEEAIADAREAIELYPDDRLAFDQLLFSYLSLEQEDKVRATIDELRAVADAWADAEVKGLAYLNIANSYLQLRETDLALAAVERAIEIDPGNPRGFISRMHIRREFGDTEGAKADCEAAARVDLGTAMDLIERGILLLGNCNDFRGALEDFSRVIALAPKWHGGYLTRGMAYFQLQHLDRALVDYNRAIELGPYLSGSYLHRGVLFLSLGRFEEVLTDYGKAMELGPYDSYVWANYGFLLFWKGRLEEGLTALDKALELNPGFADARADRGRILAHLGRCDEAAAELHKAEELALGDPWPHRSIADAYLFFFYYHCPDHYDLAEALRHAQTAYEGFPTDIWARETQALALLRNGDYAEAKQLYLELFEDIPDGTSWFPLAMCLWHLGENAEARRFYDRSVTWREERLPDSPMYNDMRQEAAELLGIQP